MNKKARVALLGSIDKWNSILNFGGIDKGGINCALCRYSADVDDSFAGECASCPVYKRTGEVGCDNTPYEDWTRHQTFEHLKHRDMKVRCPKCSELARDELIFLKSLLPDSSDGSV